MINQIIPIKAHFPKINTKNHSLRAVLISIHEKKHQLQKQLTKHESQDVNFPSIINQNHQLTADQRFLTNKQYQSQIIKVKAKPYQSSLIPKYKAFDHRTPQQNNKKRQKISKFFGNEGVKDSINVENDVDKESVRNKRIKTEIKNKKNYDNLDQFKHFQEIEERQQTLHAIEEAKLKFLQLVPNLPHLIKNKTQDNLEQVVQHLQTFNPFFNRSPRLLNICLLKMGKIISLKTCKLYQIGQQLKYFYIILLGKVKLSNGSLRKICQTGQIILQQIMFQTQHKKISLQKAKTLGHTVLLLMKLADYARMKQQLIKHGYKINFLEMESIIKRNYIVKNWLRNRIKLQNNK